MPLCRYMKHAIFYEFGTSQPESNTVTRRVQQYEYSRVCTQKASTWHLVFSSAGYRCVGCGFA